MNGKKTVETPANFSNFKFIDTNDLVENYNSISQNLAQDQTLVLYLTLQDLNSPIIKTKHQELFKEQVDLLIIDETHFGARAQSLGKVLATNSVDNDKIEKKNLAVFNKDDNYLDQVIPLTKTIKAKVRLHLSGTPYRILLGNEFSEQDIIAFVQFTDIVADQQQWDKQNLCKDDVNEWENPYFGFPQMIRFAFNPSQAWRDKLLELEKQGISHSLSDLFKPKAYNKDNKDYIKFVFENEVLELLQVIDGTKDDEQVFGFLDYPKIHDGKMCRHMVMVLPYCASCDAMEQLLHYYRHTFKNLNQYKIINISGLEARRHYKTPLDIKTEIALCESNNQKTITLTVNRMLTGSTVEQWDTILFLKETSSPQEYDQATFRWQNQYIRTLQNSQGEIIKENLKPQTLLIDFSPNSLFSIQEQKSSFYNMNTQALGNNKLKQRIAQELKISPIVIMDNYKLKEVTPNNVLEIISKYSSNISINDELANLPVDLTILTDPLIANTIAQQKEFTSKQGLFFNPIANDPNLDNEPVDFEQATVVIPTIDNEESSRPEQDLPQTQTNVLKSEENSDSSDKNLLEESLKNKIKTYYLRILFFTFLIKGQVYSLDDILEKMQLPCNRRILKNLDLDPVVLINMATNMDFYKRSCLDCKIQNISLLTHDSSLTPLECALRSLSKFSRMSNADILTPQDICQKMINLFPQDKLQQIVEQKQKVIDLASKSGEFAIALYQKFTQDLGFKHDQVKDLICSVTTSTLSYEFTRKFYEILGLNLNNIATKFTSYDLINSYINNQHQDYSIIGNLLCQSKPLSDISLTDIINKDDNIVKFGAAVGNPPYQLTVKQATKGNNANTVDIYPHFQELAFDIAQSNCLLYPAKDYQRGKKELNDPRLVYLRIFNGSNKASEKNIPHENSIFGDSVRRITGDVGLFYFENYNTDSEIVYQETNINSTNKILPVRKEFIPLALKLQHLSGQFQIGTIKKCCESSFVQDNPHAVLNEVTDRNATVPAGYTKVLTNNIASSGGKAKWFYIKTDSIPKPQAPVYKVVIGSAYPNESLKNPNNIEILTPNEMFGRSRLSLYACANEVDALNFVRFLQTKFVKTIIQMTPLKIMYYLPDFDQIKAQLDWTQSLEEIDAQLFKLYNLSADDINTILQIS